MAAGSTRRAFLTRVARYSALATAGGMAWSWVLGLSRDTAFAFRPPGALEESAYQGACIKCGLCVEACPYNTLALTGAGETGTPGIPRFVPRETPCYMCTDVPCARACPTGALDKKVEIQQARMGLAVLSDQETCLAFLGLRCEVCYRVCPLIDKAITLRYRSQARTGAHAFFEPVVNSDACTGCGMCEHACVLEEAAIKVFPRALAKGKASRTYRMGWKEPSGVSRDFKPGDAVQPPGENSESSRKSLERALKGLEDVEGLYD